MGQLTCLSVSTSDVRIFSYTLWPFPCLLWRNVHLDLWPIFYWIVCFWYWAVWIFVRVKVPVSIFIYTNCFHSWLSFFLSLMVSFVVQMLLTSVRSHLFIFVLYVLILRRGSKKILLHFTSECVLLFFPNSSIEYVHLFRPSNFLQFIFVFGVRE